MAQRVSKTTGASSWTLFMRKIRLPSPAMVSSILPRSKRPPAPAAAPSSPSSTRALSRSVCRRPMSHVPAFESPL